MPEWKQEIGQRLASLELEPAHEAEIVEELSQHLEDHYAESLARGATPEEASRAALAELSESETLQLELRRVERASPQEPIGRRVQTFVNVVSHSYLETMKIKLLAGRHFNERDDAASPRVAIISETLQRRAWPNENPIGKRFSMGDSIDGSGYMPMFEVIGVARDITLRHLFDPAGPAVYFPLLQNYHAGIVLHLRSTANPEQLTAAVRREVGALDLNLPVYRMALLEDHFTAALTPQRLLTQLISGFGLLALALAGAGLYGSLAYSVAQRTQEIGLRIALGARSRDVLKLVVLDGMKLTLLGLIIGLPASYGLTKLMKSYLYGVSLTDPLTFAVISATLLAVALFACYAPARRAASVDPMVALRCE
ncbi:MAG: FtsX-like permease family protein [Blastocatellia bacterium]